jgi:hypothetical protein
MGPRGDGVEYFVLFWTVIFTACFVAFVLIPLAFVAWLARLDVLAQRRREAGERASESAVAGVSSPQVLPAPPSAR